MATVQDCTLFLSTSFRRRFGVGLFPFIRSFVFHLMCRMSRFSFCALCFSPSDGLLAGVSNDIGNGKDKGNVGGSVARCAAQRPARLNSSPVSPWLTPAFVYLLALAYCSHLHLHPRSYPHQHPFAFQHSHPLPCISVSLRSLEPACPRLISRAPFRRFISRPSRWFSVTFSRRVASSTMQCA